MIYLRSRKPYRRPSCWPPLSHWGTFKYVSPLRKILQGESFTTNLASLEMLMGRPSPSLEVQMRHGLLGW